jgi:hypothetical protein
MTWVAPITFVAATALTAAQMNQNVRDNTTALSDRIQEVYKSADEIVNNSTTLQNDNELLFTAVAGQKYLFTVNLIHISVSASADINVGFTFPTGTMNWLGVGMDLAATVNPASVRMAGTVGAASGTALAFGTLTTTSGSQITGTYACTTGGTVQLQWAQNTLTASDTTVKAGSSIQAIRVTT